MYTYQILTDLEKILSAWAMVYTQILIINGLIFPLPPKFSSVFLQKKTPILIRNENSEYN